MAGLGGLPAFLQYQQAAQQQANQNQQAKIQLANFQQQQAQQRQQQAASMAAGNALPQLLAGGQAAAQPQMPPPPQAPQPGQPSQPMQMPQGAAPMPGQGPAPGPMNRPPMPPGGPQGQMPPPFRPMPSSPPPQQQAGPSAIGAPPSQAQPQQQSGPLTLQSAVKVLQDQGLSGADLMAGLQQLMPMMDSQAKAQAAQAQTQFNQQLHLSQLANQRDSLQARIDASKEAAEDRHASLQERTQAHQDSLGMQQQLMQFRIQEAKMKHAADPDAKLSPEDVHFLAQQAAAGDTSVYQNLGRGVQGAQNIVAIRREVAKMNTEEGKTGADQAAANVVYGGEKSAARTGATRAANIGMAVAEAQQTFPLLRKASADLARTQFVPVNRALQSWETNTGDPKVISFGAALNTSINAYARAISPTGVPTVSDKEHARQVLSTANTPEQLNAAVDMMEKEMAAARQAPEEVQAQQRKRISGRGEGAPSVGTIEGGYRFKGGDPSSQSSWEKAQ